MSTAATSGQARTLTVPNGLNLNNEELKAFHAMNTQQQNVFNNINDNPTRIQFIDGMIESTRKRYRRSV
jgi:hypothetical protein